MGPKPDQDEQDRKVQEYEDQLILAHELYEEAFAKNGCPWMDVNEFRCEGAIGEGGWGLVLRATKDDRSYAIKVVNKASLRQNDGQKKIVREKTRQFAFDNEFVTKLFGRYKDLEYIYMFFEYARYGDLSFFLAKCPDEAVPESRAREILCQVALGLEYCHYCAVVVRDVKLANILIFDGGRVKIADFGLACVTWVRPVKPWATAGYIAPEMLGGKGYYECVDWWAFGIVCFKTLIGCGEHPYEDLPGKDELEKITNNELDFSNAKWGQISDDCKRFVKGLLQIDYTQRIGYKDAQGGNWKHHAWFANVDWYHVLYDAEQFEVDPLQWEGFYSGVVEEFPFVDISPHIEDPIRDEVDDF